MSKVSQRFIIIFIPTMILLLLCSLAYERSHYQAKKLHILEQENTYVNEQSAQVDKIFPLIVSDINVLRDLEEIRAFAEGASTTSSIASLEQKLLSFLTFKRVFDQIRVIDSQGVERVRVNGNGQNATVVPQNKLQDKSGRFYFSKAMTLKPNDIYVSPFDLNIEQGQIEKPLKPIIRFAVPIVDSQQQNKGILIVNYLGVNLLADIQRTPISGSHGKLMLVNKEGYWLKGLQEKNEWGFMISSRSKQTMAQQFPDAWKDISSHNSGQLETDAGLFSYITIHPLHKKHNGSYGINWVKDDGDWILISFVDQSTLTKQLLPDSILFLVRNLAALVLLIIGVWWLVRIQTDYKVSQKNLLEAEKMINQLRESLNNGFVRYNLDGEILDYNEAYRKMFGFEADELKGTFLQQLTEQRSLSIENDVIDNQLMMRGYSDVYEKESVRKDGSHFPVEKRSFVSLNEDKQVESIWAIVSDISQRKKYEEKLRLLASVFENTIEGIIITDFNGVIQEVNPGFSTITGYSSDEVIGKKPSILRSEHHGPDFYAEMWRTISEKGHWSGEIWNRRKGGETFPERLSISAVSDYKGNVSHYISVFYDISDIKHGEKQLQHQAYHDALTGLPNRLLFLDRLTNALLRARRKNGQVGVLFLDMDNFKTINDSLGHNVGDRLLKEVARILVELLREEDTVSRFGGDEFVVLASATESEWNVCEIANRISAAFTQPISIDSQEFYVSFSIGISLFPNDGVDAESLIKNADLAMYQAKTLGKNCYHLYTESMNVAVSRRLELQNNLRRALDKEEFEVFYQPKVDITNGSIVGCEALIRWRREGEIISPAEFIPLAEETGLIVPIGEWVLRKACTDAQCWQQSGYPLTVAVNLSPRQFHQKDLVPMVLSVLQDTGLSPLLLELEITEGIVMDDVNEAIDTLNQLRTKGIHFAIDDFGTGYSSLQYLRQLPLDTLKIDRAFIKDLPENKEDAAIAIATISMAHALRLNVVAEGVESQAQLEFLKLNACEQYQGYLFSKPLEKSEFFQLLSRSS
ncbi:EAL domain-containing protein [Vibrio sp. MA40-2]|uniref:bifunctional diguanylate cyclase/phosphodiesterase n=1 Tax=Vibrio sp. MA40-2 TaxID=3391828 RepID=UPI0039A648C9